MRGRSSYKIALEPTPRFHMLILISAIAFFLTSNLFRFKLVEKNLIFSSFSTKK